MHFRPCKAHFGDYYYCRIVGIFAKSMISREGEPLLNFMNILAGRKCEYSMDSLHIFMHLSVRPLYILWIRCFTVSHIGISMPLSYVVDKSVLTTSLLSTSLHSLLTKPVLHSYRLCCIDESKSKTSIRLRP